MSTILDAAQLCRTFGKGEHAFTAVDNVSLSISSGEIHALLGPNGAGKTTIVQMCATLLTPTSGTVRIDGVDALAHPQRARASLGLALGGDTGFYPRASARDNLLFFADLAGVSARKRRAQVASALERVDLADVAAKKVQEFSRGMKQRLHIGRALLGEPKLLLLDEPTNGLDPDISLTIRQLIRSLADDGTAILLTSHLLGEIEELAHRVTVIGAGRVAVSGTVADVATHAGISATTVGRVGANAGPVLQELTRPNVLFPAPIPHGSLLPAVTAAEHLWSNGPAGARRRCLASRCDPRLDSRGHYRQLEHVHCCRRDPQL